MLITPDTSDPDTSDPDTSDPDTSDLHLRWLPLRTLYPMIVSTLTRYGCISHTVSLSGKEI